MDGVVHGRPMVLQERAIDLYGQACKKGASEPEGFIPAEWLLTKPSILEGHHSLLTS